MSEYHRGQFKNGKPSRLGSPLLIKISKNGGINLNTIFSGLRSYSRSATKTMMRITMSRRAVRAGDSLTVTIPKPFAEALDLHVGDMLTFAIEGDGLTIKKGGDASPPQALGAVTPPTKAGGRSNV